MKAAATGPTVHHDYATAGSYPIHVNVTDALGGRAASSGLVAISPAINSGAVNSSGGTSTPNSVWEIFGAENYFLELMDHGLDIERRVRDGLLEIGRTLNIPLLATNDCHYVTRDAAHNHEALLCVQTGKTLSDPNRFKFDGDGYYLKSAAEMRAIWDGEVAEACDSTLLIAERVTSYADVWAPRDRMPVFPVPDGDTGTNMYLTVRSAMLEAGKLNTRNLAEVAAAAAQGSLMGARGNSGVIISQMLRGFAHHVRHRSEIDTFVLATAMREGVTAARQEE